MPVAMIWPPSIITGKIVPASTAAIVVAAAFTVVLMVTLPALPTYRARQFTAVVSLGVTAVSEPKFAKVCCIANRLPPACGFVVQ